MSVKGAEGRGRGFGSAPFHMADAMAVPHKILILAGVLRLI